jgi:glycerol-3-phosphate dehydrogenase subunit B
MTADADISEDIRCQVCVIGTGLAGLAAGVFAVNRGLKTVQIGSSGEIIFASGLLDLMGVYPLSEQRTWRDPWAAIRALSAELPQHPYARLTHKDIEAALAEQLAFLEATGLSYVRRTGENVCMPTPLGTVKVTHAVPATMWPAVKAFENRSACLLVDIEGLKGFSARQMAAVLKPHWPRLETARLAYPPAAAGGEVYPERLARSLELESNRERIAAELKALVGRHAIVGLPAILGVAGASAVRQDLQDRLGCTLFELPTIPPSVPGLRLKETFERELRRLGVTLYAGHKVARADLSGPGPIELEFRPSEVQSTCRVQADAVILASGRFLGGGLKADRWRVSETIMNLPVTQPEDRSQWHRREFLDPGGHPINRCGLEFDAQFRPLNPSGEPVHPRLHAVGSILAHQDWMRMKCGSGLAIATAYGAVNALSPLPQSKMVRKQGRA